MSLEPEVPEVLVKTGSFFIAHGNMLNRWGSKLKVMVLVLALVAYVYVLFSLKTAYMRSNRLDSIETLTLKNEKLINHIHSLDHQLAMRVDRLNEFYEDY